ncbi:MAG: aldehyde dehydrogenase family protein, partial [Oceanococcaceae bacterium]
MTATAQAASADPRFENAALADMKRIFSKQQSRAIQLRTSTYAERLAKLNKLRDAVLKYENQIIEACKKDLGRPETEATLGDIVPILQELKHTRKHLKKWMKGEFVMPTMMMFGTKTRVRYEPKGVSLIIAPWNYPVTLALGPLVPALATGCTAIIKPSELTPHCSQVVKDLINETFDESDVAVVEGAVEETTALLELPFDHIFFTGSPAVGKIVMAAAAKHLTSVTLELGGKSPTIVDQTADIERAAKGVAFGKFLNVGQTCIAPDYLYVHESIKEPFLKALSTHLQTTYGKDSKASADLGRIVNDRHFSRVSSLIAEAVGKGANVVCGGATDEAEKFIAPTVMDQVPADARIMSEEIFGPVLPVIGYTDLDKVIAEINAQPKPLGLYVYTRDNATARKVIENTSSGGACVNTCTMQFLHANAPFGGVNNSGIGTAHGKWGFKAFSHERT